MSGARYSFDRSEQNILPELMAAVDHASCFVALHKHP